MARTGPRLFPRAPCPRCGAYLFTWKMPSAGMPPLGWECNEHWPHAGAVHAHKRSESQDELAVVWDSFWPTMRGQACPSVPRISRTPPLWLKLYEGQVSVRAVLAVQATASTYRRSSPWHPCCWPASTMQMERLPPRAFRP